MRRAIAAFRHAHQELQTSSTASSSRGLPLTAAALASRAAVTAGRGQERVRAYLAARVTGVTRSAERVGYTLSFEMPPGARDVKWDDSKRFMKGSLLALYPQTPGDFADSGALVLATVLRSVEGPEKLRAPSVGSRRAVQWQPTVGITVDAVSRPAFERAALAGDAFTMIESPVFFESYRGVLGALQTMATEDVPFLKLLLGTSQLVLPPQYLEVPAPGAMPLGAARAGAPAGMRFATADLTASGPRRPWRLGSVFPSLVQGTGSGDWIVPQTLPPRLTASRTPHESEAQMPYFPDTLEASQRAAISHALSRRVAIIQGPPGCGKTYVGVLITRLLLANAHLRARKPILFVCQTNHALDQILELVHSSMTSPPDILRVGSRSKSALMQTLGLVERKKQLLAQQRGSTGGSGVRVPLRGPAEHDARDRLEVAMAGLSSLFKHGAAVAAGIAVPDTSLYRLLRLLPKEALPPLEAVLRHESAASKAAWRAVQSTEPHALVTEALELLKEADTPELHRLADLRLANARTAEAASPLHSYRAFCALDPLSKAKLLAAQQNGGAEGGLVQAWCAAARARSRRAGVQELDVVPADEDGPQDAPPVLDEGDTLLPAEAELEDDDAGAERSDRVLDDGAGLVFDEPYILPRDPVARSAELVGLVSSSVVPLPGELSDRLVRLSSVASVASLRHDECKLLAAAWSEALNGEARSASTKFFEVRTGKCVV